jgi:hypothetical protein
MFECFTVLAYIYRTYGALRELSVGLYRGNFLSYRASVGMLARSSGASFRAGMRVPTDECVE